jgi:hypothetical protein
VQPEANSNDICKARENADINLVKVPQKHDRAGSSEREATDLSDARIQAIHMRRDYHCQH